MDHNEAAELAYFGAKVLHPRTIEPVRRKGILLVVKNSFDPDARGTIIRGQRINGGVTLRSVAVKSDLSIVKVYSSEIVYQPGLISRLVGVISDAAVNSYAVSTSLSTLAMVIPSTAAEEVKRRIDALNEPQVGEGQCEEQDLAHLLRRGQPPEHAGVGEGVRESGRGGRQHRVGI